jgi:hypothetical protein
MNENRWSGSPDPHKSKFRLFLTQITKNIFCFMMKFGYFLQNLRTKVQLGPKIAIFEPPTGGVKP